MVNDHTPATWPGRMTHPRHVFVDSGNVASPGLLLMWRQSKDGWEGWCVWADYYAPHEQLSVRQGWVTGERIKPLPSSEAK